MTADIEEAIRSAMRNRDTLPAPEARKRVRENAGFSLRALADILGVSESIIRLWESGDRQPTGVRLQNYSAALRVMQEESK